MAASDHLSQIQFDTFHSEHAGGAVSAMHGDREIGSLSWYPSGTIDTVKVDPEFRRQGIATEMYRRGQQLTGNKIRHSSERTNLGDAWAHHVGGDIPDRTVVLMNGERDVDTRSPYDPDPDDPRYNLMGERI